MCISIIYLLFFIISGQIFLILGNFLTMGNFVNFDNKMDDSYKKYKLDIRSDDKPKIPTANRNWPIYPIRMSRQRTPDSAREYIWPEPSQIHTQEASYNDTRSPYYKPRMDRTYVVTDQRYRSIKTKRENN